MKLSTAVAKIQVNEPLNLTSQIAFDALLSKFYKYQVRYCQLIRMIDIDLFEIQLISRDIESTLKAMIEIDSTRFYKETFPLLDDNFKSLIPRKEGH